MSCERFDDDLIDIARGEERDDEGRRAALAHAEICVRCAARLEDERAVTSALRAFATRTAGAEAPPRVEATLLRARRQPAEPSGVAKAPSRSFDLLLLAVAAVILVAIVVVPPRFEQRRESTPSTLPAAAALVGGAEAPEESAEFVALRYGEDLRELDSLQVVSVELPHTALAALGWPAQEGAQDPVKADVIVGHDGVARAIRFVE